MDDHIYENQDLEKAILVVDGLLKTMVAKHDNGELPTIEKGCAWFSKQVALEMADAICVIRRMRDHFARVTAENAAAQAQTEKLEAHIHRTIEYLGADNGGTKVRPNDIPLN